MKYIILIGDGMADRPLPQLGNKTPLQAARIPNLNSLAQKGSLGLAKTIPDNFTPGSDVANMTVLGYSANEYYTGRSPLEAANIGIKLKDDDIAFRCNFVTLENNQMKSFCADHIDTESAGRLIEALNEKLGNEEIKFYRGISYRHLMVWHGGKSKQLCTPPHDISGKPVKEYLPQGDGADFINDLMKQSQGVLENHPVNKERIKKGKLPATSIWLWGQGKRPQLPTLQERYNVKGALISAVDLLKGIGIYLGMSVINVPGATGYLDTNYAGKAQAAIDALADHDFVYLHLEAPDEAGHNGDMKAKIEAIEAFDEKIVGPVWKALEKMGDYRLLVMPDHATPVSIKTHSCEPVPFILYPGEKHGVAYNEKAASDTKYFVGDGCRLINFLLGEK